MKNDQLKQLIDTSSRIILKVGSSLLTLSSLSLIYKCKRIFIPVK